MVDLAEIQFRVWAFRNFQRQQRRNSIFRRLWLSRDWLEPRTLNWHGALLNRKHLNLKILQISFDHHLLLDSFKLQRKQALPIRDDAKPEDILIAGPVFNANVDCRNYKLFLLLTIRASTSIFAVSLALRLSIYCSWETTQRSPPPRENLFKFIFCELSKFNYSKLTLRGYSEACLKRGFCAIHLIKADECEWIF